MHVRMILWSLFQSTRSARSATVIAQSEDLRDLISIHALRKERDFHHLITILVIFEFQSTRSARSATFEDAMIAAGIMISIHALRKERDPGQGARGVSHRISIHALRKERD